MACCIEGWLPSCLLEHAWVWAFQLPALDVRDYKCLCDGWGISYARKHISF